VDRLRSESAGARRRQVERHGHGVQRLAAATQMLTAPDVPIVPQ
jgi:hypothetical protein